WSSDVCSSDLSQRPSLDRLGEDAGRRILRLRGAQVGGVDLAPVMTSAAQLLELFVGEMLHHRAQLGIGSEEVLADVGAGVGSEALELSVQRLVHLLHEQAVDILGQEFVPLAS